jgi:hypothetical protein
MSMSVRLVAIDPGALLLLLLGGVLLAHLLAHRLAHLLAEFRLSLVPLDQLLD